MDLNIVIYDNKEFLPENIISKMIDSCHAYGFKKIGSTVRMNGQDIQKLPIPPRFEVKQDNFQILTRLTVKVEDGGCLYHLMKHDNLKHYDLLALEPANEKMLNYLTSGNVEFDILTFDQVDSTIVNMIKKANFSLPIKKGIGIEINYSNCFSSSSQRRQMLALGQMLVDKTVSKNIILSSGANVFHNIRSPRDVIYIGLLFGLQENQSKKALYQNTVGVIKHSELRKNIIKSIIDTVDDETIIEELVKDNKTNNDNDNSWIDETQIPPKKRKLQT